MTSRVLGIGFATAAMLACDGPARGPDALHRSRDEPRSDSLEPPEAHRSLVLDRVLAGGDESDGLSFGLVRHLAVETSGAIVVEDAMGRAVVRLSPNGELRDSLGRAGPGPGEYRSPYGVAALPEGHVAVRDNQPPSIIIFDSLGGFVREWPLLDRVRFSEGLDVEMSADADGLIRLLVPTSRSANMYDLPEYRFVALTPTGQVVDSVSPLNPAQERGVRGEYQPRAHLAWHPAGFPVVGSSEAYRIELQRPDGAVTIERHSEPIPVTEEEKEADRVVREWQRARGAVDLETRPAPPDFKAAFARILVAETGEIWVFRHGMGEHWGTRDLGNGLAYPRFREPIEADVFDAEGRFLQTVGGAANIDPKVIRGDTVWAVLTGTHEEHYVARYLVR